MSSYRLGEKIFLTAAVLIGTVFLFLRFGEFPVGAGMDDAYYIEMARSIAEGRGPAIHLNEVGGEWRPGLFPVGFPYLLSPVAAAIPTSVQVFKLVTILAWLALVPVCLFLARWLPSVYRVALAAVVCLNPWTVAYAVRVFSDLPFAAVSLTAVILFIGLSDLPRIRTHRFAALILVTAAAVMVRSVGLALPVSMILYWILHRRWLRAFFLLVGVAAVLLPHALASGQSGAGLITPSYLQQVFVAQVHGVSRGTIMLDNLAGYLRELPVVLLPVFGSPLESLAARSGLGTVYGPGQLLAGVFLVAGIIRGLIIVGRGHPGRSRFLFIYLLVYAGVLLNFSGYPSGVQSRLILPVLPLLYLMLLVAIRGGQETGRIFGTTVAVLIAFCLVHNGYRAARPMNLHPEVGGQIILNPGLGSPWIRAQTRPDDVIMVRHPLRQHIHFLRPVIGFGTAGGRQLDPRLSTYGVDYIFLGPEPDPSVPASLMNRFEMVHRDKEKEFLVFRVRPGP